MNKNFLLSMFILYTILFQGMVWGGFFYIVFILNHSAWWVALAIVLAASQFKPYHFGIVTKKEYGDSDE